MFLFQALASGSSGNAFLLRTPKATLLFDAGLRLPTLIKYLATEGVAPESISAVLLSHEHRDHCVSARDLAVRHNATVCANVDVLRAVGLHELPRAQVLENERPTLFGDVVVTSFPVQHDAVRPVGFLIEVEGRTITIATDLGHATTEVTAAVAAADLVVLEANHDAGLLRNGRYPAHLRKRVAGPTGHLSNEQAGALLAAHLKTADTEVWLAHLSRENNTSALALKTVRSFLGGGRREFGSVGIALRDRPSLRWTGATRPRQLSLFAGWSGVSG